MKFTIITEKGTKIQMELGQEIDITLTDTKTKVEKNVLISIKEK